MLKWLQDKSADFAAGIYDGWTGSAGKLSGGLALPRLSTWLGRTFSKRPALLGIELFVALSLTVNFYWLVRPTCLPYRDGNTISRSVFAYLSKYANPAGKEQMQLNWQKRLAGPILSAGLIDAEF